MAHENYEDDPMDTVATIETLLALPQETTTIPRP